MRTLSNTLITIGIFLFFAAPIYQTIDATIKNEPGDGIKIYGDNFIFRNVLGVKVEHHNFFAGSGWEWSYSVFYTPTWMQKIFNFKKAMIGPVGCHWHHDKEECSTAGKMFSFRLVRTIIKLLIPGIPFLLGIWISNKKTKL